MHRTSNPCDKPAALVARCFLLKIALPPEPKDHSDSAKESIKTSKPTSDTPVTH